MNNIAKKIQKLIFLFCVLFSTMTFATEKKVVKIACVGNSITYGARIVNRSQNCYPSILQKMLGSEYYVENFGVSGSTCLSKGNKPYVKEKAYKKALDFNPDIVTIKLGTNDSKPYNWCYKDEFKNDLKTLVESFENLPSKPKVYLCLPVPVTTSNFNIKKDVVANEVVPAVKEVAREKTLEVIDLYSAMTPYPDYYADGVHPSALGAAVIASEIYKTFTGKVYGSESEIKSLISSEIEDTAFDFADRQLRYAIKETAKAFERTKGSNKVLVSPRTVEKSEIKFVASNDWTSGFFAGELWYMYEYSKDEFWKNNAEKATRLLENEKFNNRTHDMGFKMYCSYGNAYRLTGKQYYKDVLLTSAKTLMTRYNENVGCVRSWDHHRDKWQYPVIIDNMMNLELLYWAFKETGDSAYYKVATSHSLRTMKEHYRKDYSTYHVIDYDTLTGKVLHRHNHQGWNHESSWARGQAWGLYGFTMVYRETGMKEFLDHAIRIANYILTNKNLPSDKIPYWDYCAPNIPNEPRDVSAASIMASAFYDLSKFDKANEKKYIQTADTIIENLISSYKSQEKKNGGFILLHSTGGKGMEVDVPLVYADYYFLEALLKKRNLVR